MDRRADRLGHIRFFLEPDQIRGERGMVSGAEQEHMIRVCRHGVGDLVQLTDGRGTLYQGEILAVSSEAATLQLRIVPGEPRAAPPPVALALPLLKGDRTERVIRQAVELGVAELFVYQARRGRGRPGATRRDRWDRVARNALTQCLGLDLPELSWWESLTDLIRETRRYPARWVATPGAEALWRGPERSSEETSGGFLVLVGPEGGLAPEERHDLEEEGFRPFGLGPRRLRSETAAVTALIHAQVLTTSPPRDSS